MVDTGKSILFFVLLFAISEDIHSQNFDFDTFLRDLGRKPI